MVAVAPAPRVTASVSTSVSVVIACYTMKRYGLLSACIASLERQVVRPDQIIVAVDHCDELADALEARRDVEVVRSSFPPGAAGTRNAAIAASRGEFLFFIDDDAVADAFWIARLLRVFDDSEVVVAGGAIRPRWQRGRPAWFPPEFDWVVGCTYAGQPVSSAPVRNVIACNMAVRRDALMRVGGFRCDLGRTATEPLGCEETELCIRVRKATGSARSVMYEPAAIVTQAVPDERARLRYLVARCRAEGRSKAAITRYVGTHDALETEASYVRRVLTHAIARGVRDGLHGHGAGFLHSATVLVGLGATAFAYARARLPERRR